MFSILLPMFYSFTSRTILHFGEEQGRAPIFLLIYVLFIDVFIYLIYFNTNNFVQSGCAFKVHSIVSSAQTF